MMKLNYKNDRYQITWRCHIEQVLEAKRWCYELWQGDWGEVKFGNPNQIGLADNIFLFKLEQHANWFMLKFNKI